MGTLLLMLLFRDCSCYFIFFGGLGQGKENLGGRSSARKVLGVYNCMFRNAGIVRSDVLQSGYKWVLG